jgi:hypothetical protein
LGAPKGVIEWVSMYNPLCTWESHQISGYPSQRFGVVPERVSHEGDIGQVGKVWALCASWEYGRGLLNRWASPTLYIYQDPTKYQGIPHNALGGFQRVYRTREVLDGWVSSRSSLHLGGYQRGLLTGLASTTLYIYGVPPNIRVSLTILWGDSRGGIA